MESETGEKKSLFHPSRPFYRFSILIFIASLTFGSYFAYDIVAGISPSLVEDLGARGIIGIFYTMYSIAAILALLVAGVLIDKIGTRKASLIFSLLVLIGALLVWLARDTTVFIIGTVSLRSRCRAASCRSERHAGPLVQK